MYAPVDASFIRTRFSLTPLDLDQREIVLWLLLEGELPSTVIDAYGEGAVYSALRRLACCAVTCDLDMPALPRAQDPGGQDVPDDWTEDDLPW